MPHVTLQYSANLEAEADMGTLCAALAEVICAQRDDAGARVFPPGGTRVFAYPAAHAAVADGHPDRAFVYINVKIAPSRPQPLVAATGEAMMAVARAHLAALFATRALGVTLHIEEGSPVFDTRHSTLHPLFAGK